MRFRFIQRHQNRWPISCMCRVLRVSPSGYWAFVRREPSARCRSDHKLAQDIVRIHRHSRRTYGSRRVGRELAAQGQYVGRHRVRRLMRENGLWPRRKRIFVRTTDSKHNLPVADNVLGRNFSAEAPNRVWVTDITYVPTAEGWLYLAAIVDLFSRRVVGWAASEHIDRQLCLQALTDAGRKRGAVPGLVHHSDRGSQYASHDYQKALTDGGMLCSMSRKGDCWDNAVAESFFATLKTELIHLCRFQTRREARTAIFDYIEVFYNRVRRHSSLDYQSPLQYEQQHYAASRLAA